MQSEAWTSKFKRRIWPWELIDFVFPFIAHQFFFSRTTFCGFYSKDFNQISHFLIHIWEERKGVVSSVLFWDTYFSVTLSFWTALHFDGCYCHGGIFGWSGRHLACGIKIAITWWQKQCCMWLQLIHLTMYAYNSDLWSHSEVFFQVLK